MTISKDKYIELYSKLQIDKDKLTADEMTALLGFNYDTAVSNQEQAEALKAIAKKLDELNTAESVEILKQVADNLSKKEAENKEASSADSKLIKSIDDKLGAPIEVYSTVEAFDGNTYRFADFVSGALVVTLAFFVIAGILKVSGFSSIGKV